ncbi:MAG: FeoB-associated Cys-rich membrane protein [Spirosomataceae bacterium]
MIENLVITLLFAGALAYLGRLFWKQFFAKTQAGCAKGCGSCSAIDARKIEQALEAKQ